MSVVATWWWWYDNFAPHDRPFPHVNWVWGFLHGFLVWFNFVYELFDHKATIYQSPNTGAEYDCGFVFGAFLFHFLLIWRIL
jgi:hypothetical protein